MNDLTRSLTVCLLALASSDATVGDETGVSRIAVSSKLTNPPCKTMTVNAEGGESEQVCPGPAGYKLLLLDSDGRMSVTIMTPEGTKRPLDFATVVTPHFSAVGKSAEWRFRDRTSPKAPTSVIIPLEVKEDPETNKATPYWVVARITANTACVVQSIKGREASLSEARKLADSETDPTCLPAKP